MTIHKPVLLNETIESLNLKPDAIVVDATLGGGGHSCEILKIIKNGKLIGIDADIKAIENFRKENKQDERIILVNDNFANLENILADLKIEKVDAILADLGWSSDQLVGKGMSFMQEEELDMRLDAQQESTAKKIVNEYPQAELQRLIKNYGEERFATSIARKIVAARKDKEIVTTKELAEIIGTAVPSVYKHGKINPATRTFQAIRIEVNHELENLEKFLPIAIQALDPKGRLAVIAFHSLEDRIIKDIFRRNARGCICPPTFPQCVCGESPVVLVITKKPIVASDGEIGDNPRARSAKLRVCEKI
ncbi:MAG: 16S rRNA (cytosine(1402)-N(4))-methyltransferase RsmH [Parcubacteria group bacterium]